MLKIPIVLVKISARNLSTDNLSHLQSTSCVCSDTPLLRLRFGVRRHSAAFL
jgi:hypothetical protein